MDAITIIGAVLVFLFGTTYALKATGKAQTFWIISLIRTKKFLPLLEKIKKHERTLNLIADAGLILGFGAVAVDYLWGRKKSAGKRIALFAISAVLLYVLLEVLSRVFFVFQVLFSNPFTEYSNTAVKIAFALFGFAGSMVVILAAYGWFVVESILAGKKACPGIAPMIPGVKLPKIPIVVPVHGWLSFLIILLLHEGMHGALARKARVKIKSAGLLLLGLLPVGAFVEPEEKQLRKTKPLAQLRVYSAGPSSNLLMAMAISLVVTLFVAAVFTPFFSGWAKEVKLNSVSGVFVSAVDQNIDICGEYYENPAYGKLAPGMQLLKINDKNITTQDDAAVVLYNNRTKPFTVEALDANGALVKQTVVPNELGLATFEIEEKPNPSYTVPYEFELFSGAGGLVTEFLFWLMLLSFLIALVNFLPTDPFDGGRIAKILLLPYFGFLKMGKKETEKFIGRLLLWIIAGILLLNALPLLL